MLFKLHLLKFHAFRHSKNLTNYVDIKYDWDSLWRKMNKKIKHIKQFNDLKNSKTGCHDHILDENGFNILYRRIISNCHPTLKNELEQLMEPLYSTDKKIHEYFYQFHLDTKSAEVVFAFFYTTNNQEVVMPLIFDLNHCIYKVDEDKSYSYKYKKSWKEWNLKGEQDYLKSIILNHND